MGIEMISGNPGTEIRPVTVSKGKSAKADVVGKTSRNDVEMLAFREHANNKVYFNKAIEKLKKVGDLFNRRLDFRVDEETNRVVVKVIDTKTDKVIKEIPPEQLLHLAAKIQEMIGLLFDEER